MSKPSKLGCHHPQIERRKRVGVLDALMFRFGRYPWTCRMCGCRLYIATRRRERPTMAAARVPASGVPENGTIAGAGD